MSDLVMGVPTAEQLNEAVQIAYVPFMNILSNTQEYAEKHPEVLEENVNIEISEDGKEVEVTTDDGEEVEVKNETPDDVEEPTVEDELDENKKLSEEVTDDTIVKIEPRYLVGKDGKHFDQTVFFKVTYKVVKGYLIPVSEEIIGWTWGETDKYSGEGNNLKADYSGDLQVAVDDINNGNTSNYMTVDSLSENKKLQEDISAAPFRDLMYDCLQDDIEPADVMAERMLNAWSDDDCKWYCETYELVTPHNDFKDEEHYYEDIYGNIRDITGQIADDDNLEEAKNRKVKSIKALEERKNKAKCCDEECCIDVDEKTFNEALAKHLKVETVENARIIENSGKILLKAKIVNENKTKGICFEMNKISENKNFVRYSLAEQKSIKTENKTNQPNLTLLAYNKNNKLECRYIIKK